MKDRITGISLWPIFWAFVVLAVLISLYAVYMLGYRQGLDGAQSVVLPSQIEREYVTLPAEEKIVYIVDTVEICSAEPVVINCNDTVEQPALIVYEPTATAYVDPDPVRVTPPPTATPTQRPPADPTPTVVQPTPTVVQPTPTAQPTEPPAQPTPSATPTDPPAQPTPIVTDEPEQPEQPDQQRNCNNGTGNGPDCPPPGHDKNDDGVADDAKGDNDDDNSNRVCGENGKPCNNKHNDPAVADQQKKGKRK